MWPLKSARTRPCRPTIEPDNLVIGGDQHVFHRSGRERSLQICDGDWVGIGLAKLSLVALDEGHQVALMLIRRQQLNLHVVCSSLSRFGAFVCLSYHIRASAAHSLQR